jgi:hypothetical protein
LFKTLRTVNEVANGRERNKRTDRTKRSRMTKEIKATEGSFSMYKKVK